MSITSEFENRTGLAVPGAITEICADCKCSCDVLLAPFCGNYGDEAEFCSDCIHEIESQIRDNDELAELAADY